MRIAKNSFLGIAGQVIPLALSLITIPLYITEIGAPRYGALAIAWLLLGYFGQADFGIGRAITQRIGALAGTGESKGKMADAVCTALVVIGAYSLIGAGLVYVSSYLFFAGPFDVDDGLRAELLASVWLLALCNPLVAMSGVASGSLVGLERFKLVAISNVVSQSGLQLLPLFVAYWIGPDLKNLILAAIVGRLPGLIFLFSGIWHTFLRGQRTAFCSDEMRRLSKFGVWIMVSALVGPLMIFADRLIIGATLGAAAVAAYTIPFQLALRTQIFPHAVVNALFPRFAAETGPDALARCRNYAIFMGQIFAPLLIFLICLTGPLLLLWLGDALDQRSIIVGQILLAGVWFNTLANVPFTFIQARGNSRFTALLHIAELPVYLAMLFWLGSQYGFAGIAAAFALRCLIDCAALSAKAKLLKPELLKGHIGNLLLLSAALILSNLVSHWLALALLAVTLATCSIGLLLMQMPKDIRAQVSALPIARYVPGLRS